MTRNNGAAASTCNDARLRRYLPLLAILGGALVIRLLVIAALWDLAPTIDAGDYDRHARSLASGDGYPPTLIADPGGPTALRPPAWPAVLGGIYAFPGDGFTAGRVFAALLGTLTVCLIAHITSELWGRRAGLVAGALAAVTPSLFMLSASIMAESLFVPLVLGVVVCMIRAGRQPSRAYPKTSRDGAASRTASRTGLRAVRCSYLWALALGVLCGIAALTRVIGVLLVIPAALAIWSRPRWRPRAFVAPALVVVFFLLTVTPWTIRNTVVFGRFVPLATQEGFNLYGTYNPVSAESESFPAGWHYPLDLPRAKDLFHHDGIDEAEISERLGAWGRAYAVAHPSYVVRVVYWNTRRMLMLTPLHESERIDYQQMGVPAGWIGEMRAFTIAMYAASVLAIIRLIARRRAPTGPVVIWLVPLLLYAGAAAFLIVPRYRVPLDPFFVTVIAAAIATFFQQDGYVGDGRET